MSIVPPPDVRFYRVVESAHRPQRADNSALGTIPTRGFRYCDALTLASGFGWYGFPPMELSLLWTGNDIFWNYTGVEGWMLLSRSVQFPNLSERFDEFAPTELRGCAPPMLTAIPEAGTLQIWTGMFARTAPGWNLLVRPPANLPSPGGYSLYEGIVETDRWFGPLFTNMRLTRTNVPIRLSGDFPLVQIQPILRAQCSEDLLGLSAVGPSLAEFTDKDWADYNFSVAEPSSRPYRRFGAYASEARRARRAGCPVVGVEPRLPET